MDNSLKVKFKIGQIEFEAEGAPSDVEHQRIAFMETLLPAAIDAVVRTKEALVAYNGPTTGYIESSSANAFPIAIQENSEQVDLSETKIEDYSRINLTSFLKGKGILSDQDFVLMAAYFDEKKNGVESFTTETIKQYYAEARRPTYSNNSVLVRQLVIKGFVMDSSPVADSSAKQYRLTSKGIAYVENYRAKEDYPEKKARKPRKAKSKLESVYSSITVDDLNLQQYPPAKNWSGAKEQVVMAMFIITDQGKGEWFTVDDIQYLMTYIFELPSNADFVRGVFKRNKSWFKMEQDESNKKACKRKLLLPAKGFAKELIKSWRETQNA